MSAKSGLFLFLVCSLVWVSGLQAQETEYGEGPVYHLRVDGMIDNGLSTILERAIQRAEADSAAALLLEMDTFGGLLDAADKMRHSLLETEIPVITVIDKNAASAGALIAYSSDRILMTPGSSIGAATAVDAGGEYASEKVQSYTRGLMRSTAEATGRDPQIAEAMVDERIVIDEVVDEGQLLTLSTREAVRLGVADGSVVSIEEAIWSEGLGGHERVAYEASWAERALRFLGSPVVAGILMLMMMGGLYFELQTPGLGFAGAAAFVGATLFFAPHYLLGLAESWEIALFVVGLALLIVEIFVTPGFGVFGISGLLAVLAALFVALIPNVGFQFPAEGEIARATATLAATLVLLIVLGVSLTRYLPGSLPFQRLVLGSELSGAAGFTSAETDEALLAKTGRALTPLRPAGTAEIEGKRVDVVTTGAYIDAGAEIEVVGTRGSRVEVDRVKERKDNRI